MLELGVGAGRVAIPLARAGARVVGVDRAPRMLAAPAERVAREPDEVRARLSWHGAEAGDLELEERFDLVLAPFNAFAELAADGHGGQALGWARRHLAPTGALAFDVLVPNPSLWSGLRSTTPWFEDDETGELARCTQSFDFDAPSRTLTITTEVRAMDAAAPSRVFMLRQRQLGEDDVQSMLATHGFDLVWRTATFALPRAGMIDALPSEPEDARSDAVARVCVPR